MTNPLCARRFSQTLAPFALYSLGSAPE